eukprot:scaffold60163_cov28-Tisochrysis_lutea.AAC.3
MVPCRCSRPSRRESSSQSEFDHESVIGVHERSDSMGKRGRAPSGSMAFSSIQAAGFNSLEEGPQLRIVLLGQHAERAVARPRGGHRVECGPLAARVRVEVVAWRHLHIHRVQQLCRCCDAAVREADSWRLRAAAKEQWCARAAPLCHPAAAQHAASAGSLAPQSRQQQPAASRPSSTLASAQALPPASATMVLAPRETAAERGEREEKEDEKREGEEGRGQSGKLEVAGTVTRVLCCERVQ